MEKEIIYRELKQKEFENCLNLISKLRKNYNFNKNFIEWDYYLNPFGKPKIFVAEDEFLSKKKPVFSQKTPPVWKQAKKKNSNN